MIDDLDTAEINAVVASCATDHVFVAKQCDPREALTRTLRCGDDRARIVTFGKHDVL